MVLSHKYDLITLLNNKQPVSESSSRGLSFSQSGHLCCGGPLQGAILIMLAGALIAGATDLTYSLPGYIWVTICAVSTAMYLLLIRALKDSTGNMLQDNCLGNVAFPDTFSAIVSDDVCLSRKGCWHRPCIQCAGSLTVSLDQVM